MKFLCFLEDYEILKRYHTVSCRKRRILQLENSYSNWSRTYILSWLHWNENAWFRYEIYCSVDNNELILKSTDAPRRSLGWKIRVTAYLFTLICSGTYKNFLDEIFEVNISFDTPIWPFFNWEQMWILRQHKNRHASAP